MVFSIYNCTHGFHGEFPENRWVEFWDKEETGNGGANSFANVAIALSTLNPRTQPIEEN
jgi:hypothetical protein